jgi:MtN3 and saliva related transmembrane protein
MAVFTQVVGFLAAVVGTALMLPQVVKAIRTKKVDDISYWMLLLYFVSCLLWFTYGVLIVAWPVIVCNFIALIISIIQLYLKSKFRTVARA